MLPKSRRSEKHQRFGVWLEQTYGERAEEFADLLAHHWGQAARLAREIGLPDQWREVAPKALGYALAAGRRAARVYANEQALTHFEAARALAEDLGADTERIAAIEGLADVHALQARWDEASRLYQEALTFHTRRGDTVRQARVQSRIGSTYSGVFDFRQALPHIRSAAQALETAPGTERAERDLVPIYIQMARAQSYLGNFAQAQDYGQSAVSLAQRHHLRLQEVEARLFLAWNEVMLARPGVDVRFAELVQELEQLKDPIRLTAAYGGKAFLHRIRGEWTGMMHAAERALAVATEIGNRARIAQTCSWMGLAHFFTGNWETAGSWYQQYLQSSTALPTLTEEVRSRTAFVDGDLERACELALQAVRKLEGTGNVAWIGEMADWAGFLHLRLGRHEEGRRILTHWLGEFQRMGVFWSAYVHPLAAEIGLGLGDLTAAREHSAAAEGLLWMDLAPARARLFRARGLVKAAEQSWDEAIALIRQAIELYEAIGQPYDRARCLEALADVHLRRGRGDDNARAETAKGEAVTIYRQLGADFEVRRLEKPSGASSG